MQLIDRHHDALLFAHKCETAEIVTDGTLYAIRTVDNGKVSFSHYFANDDISKGLDRLVSTTEYFLGE